MRHPRPTKLSVAGIQGRRSLLDTCANRESVQAFSLISGNMVQKRKAFLSRLYNLSRNPKGTTWLCDARSVCRCSTNLFQPQVIECSGLHLIVLLEI